jgi:DhnA family fructose-bisphosphate aldolase class Ia
MNAGGVGLIFGRNMWQRPMEEATRISLATHEILKKY